MATKNEQGAFKATEAKRLPRKKKKALAKSDVAGNSGGKSGRSGQTAGKSGKTGG